jgi:hypothetical protein
VPRPLEPNQKFPVVLEGDEGKQPEPTFWFRSISAREHKQIRDELAEQKLDNFSWSLAFLSRVLVGWEHMTLDGKEIPFNVEDLDTLCDYPELEELIGKVTFGPRDKKNSA